MTSILGIKCSTFLTLLCTVQSGILWSETSTPKKDLYPKDYGVDVSFPIFYRLKEDTIFKQRYDKIIQGCYELYPKRDCDSNEDARLEMNRNQPRVQHNYTEMGFKKMKVPADVWEPIITFYNANKHLMKTESWFRWGYHFQNSYIISIHIF